MSPIPTPSTLSSIPAEPTCVHDQESLVASYQKLSLEPPVSVASAPFARHCGFELRTKAFKKTCSSSA